MRSPDVSDLRSAPELALVVTLDVALVGLLTTLRAEHPTIDEPRRTGDPPSLVAARRLVQRVHALRRSNSAYHSAVLGAIRNKGRESDPF